MPVSCYEFTQRREMPVSLLSNVRVYGQHFPFSFHSPTPKKTLAFD